MNFLTNILLSDEHLETLTEAVLRWCVVTGSEPESNSAQRASAVALELMTTSPNLSSEELLELLRDRLPHDDGK